MSYFIFITRNYLVKSLESLGSRLTEKKNFFLHFHTVKNVENLEEFCIKGI